MNSAYIVSSSEKRIAKYNTTAYTTHFRITPVPDTENPVNWLRNGIRETVAQSIENLNPDDLVGITFGSDAFQNGEGWLRFKAARNVDLNDIWELISSIFQSNAEGLSTDTFYLKVTTVSLPVGRGRRRIKYLTFEEESIKKRGILYVKNTDHLCLVRAILLAIATVNKEPELSKLGNDYKGRLSARVYELLSSSGITIAETGAGIPEIQKFQNYFGDQYKITVYNYGTKGRDVIYEGNSAGEKINLIYYKGHYNVIKSLIAAFGCRYYCEKCHIPTYLKNEHRCVLTCTACQKSPPCEEINRVKCEECSRTFKSQNCYDNHKLNFGIGKNKSICEQIRLCFYCLKTVIGDRKHTCGEIFCKLCYKHQPSGHLCYMLPDERKPESENFLFIFYDFETRQEKVLQNGSFLHEVNLCVFKQHCDQCINSELVVCARCGLRLQKVLGKDPISGFLSHLLQISKKFKNVVVIAHNGQAFDHQFILNHILINTDLKPDLIMRGTKIILLTLNNIRFIDSLNFFPMPLSQLPAAFGLPDQFKKGYFPHLFNTIQNEEYIGELPDVKYYSPDGMKDQERNKFLKWYEENKNLKFDMKQELIDYCVSDVDILSQSCMKFRQLLLSSSNVCPYLDACTIASACHKAFKRSFLKHGTIGIIPKNGYREIDNQSKIAKQWLIWEEYNRKINIIHASKGREQQVAGLKVDGYYKSNKEVLEFLGCYYHGCPKCYVLNRTSEIGSKSDTMEYRYQSTQARLKRLIDFGYNLTVKWECEFRKDMSSNSEIKRLTQNHPFVAIEKLNPRDSFYGGRTGNTRTYYRAGKDEKIKYLDVCSLYPYVCKYGKYPIGHPQVFVGEDCKSLDLNQTDGLMKCKILPSQDLYHPVLPQKMNNRLMFVLCNTCGLQFNHAECHHNEEERALTGTWVIDEILKAVEKGYKILEIYEIWKYNVVQYNPVSRTGGLFVEMMNKFIKIKQESSGWPASCTTPDQKQAYISRFLEKEGIQLELEKIENNPGLRSLAKLMLNSFWGKLGQSENQPKTKLIESVNEFFTIMTDPKINVINIVPVNDETLIVNYEFKEESYEPNTSVNVVLAAYTTAQARLKLYDYLDLLKERVLYYDTDSVIFTHKNGESEPATGDFIGDLTDELECYGRGSYITEFVCGGPKNYAYNVFSPEKAEEKTVCKVKGIRLNFNTSKLINFSAIKNSVLNPELEPIKTVSSCIRRTVTHNIVTKEETKLYRAQSIKRKFSDAFDSVPYGFKKMT